MEIYKVSYTRNDQEIDFVAVKASNVEEAMKQAHQFIEEKLGEDYILRKRT